MICILCNHDCHCGEKCEIDNCLCPTCKHPHDFVCFKENPTMIKQIKKWWKKYVDWLFDWK